MSARMASAIIERHVTPKLLRQRRRAPSLLSPVRHQRRKPERFAAQRMDSYFWSAYDQGDVQLRGIVLRKA